MDPERDNNETAPDTDAKNTGISADLIRGHINTIILRTLYERDKYGYEIIEEIETKSHGQYTLKQPTLYSALKRLESQGYINAYWKNDEVSQGGRRKYYTLTDSGREITERNQAEWEYSRTVIDNLISDRNFDFTQPPPAPVDFKILKNSTSRVPTVKETDGESDEGRIVNYDEPAKEQVVEIKRQDATPVVVTETEPKAEAPAEQPAIQQDIPAEAPAPVAPAPEPPRPAVEYAEPEMTEEQKKQVHENYIRLMSQPAETKSEVRETPYAESMDTNKLMYNNRPETERDYRNLINKLFMGTLRDPEPVQVYEPQPQQPPLEQQQPVYTAQPIVVNNVRVEDATSKAANDGLSVSTSDYSIGARKKRYNRGHTMLKCSLIIGVIMLLEFALCIIFKNDMGVSLAYPFVIFAIAVAQVLIFGVLCFTDIGKSSRRPTTLIYLSACIIVAVIILLIIFVTSLLLNVNFSSVGDIMAKIVVPCIITLNIPLFGLMFYLFSK